MAHIPHDIQEPDAAAEHSAGVYQQVQSTGQSLSQTLMGGSQTFNPFDSASPDAIREMLIAQIEHNLECGGDNKVFIQRAVALLGANAQVLTWMRDKHNLSIDINSIHFATELQSVADLAFDRRFRRRDPVTGEIDHIDVPDMPEALVASLRSYLGDTGGYDMEMHLNKRPRDRASEQHAYVTMNFIAIYRI